MPSHLVRAALIALLLIIAPIPSTIAPSACAETGVEFFEKRVRPLLAARCIECHGPKKQESGLRLDSRAAVLRGGDRGAAAKPGDMQSLLLVAVRASNDDLTMPPGEKRLTKGDIAALTEWVRSGLPWGAATAPATMTIEQRTAQHRSKHWAYQPITQPALPRTRNTSDSSNTSASNPDWQRVPLDAFVLARLERAMLSPSPAADRGRLIRRATLDLTGIPPTAAAVSDFVTDKRPGAYNRLIERLLASPLYGERWGRHWLDVARYADTQGYGFGGERRYPYAYTYRNYVIKALNNDKPFNRFVIEQLAADQLGLPANAPELAALGFLTVGREYKNRALEIDDQIDVATRGFLGLTVACARCHDHKYDGIPAADYYSLYGVFASSTQPKELPLIGDPASHPRYADFQKGLAMRQSELDRFMEKAQRETIESSRRNSMDYLVRVISKQPESKLEKLPFLKLKREAFKAALVRRWRGYLLRKKPDDAVWGVFRELALLASGRDYASQAGAILKRWLA